MFINGASPLQNNKEIKMDFQNENQDRRLFDNYYLRPDYTSNNASVVGAEEPMEDSSSLDALMNQKSDTLGTKLDVFLAQLLRRLRLRQENMAGLDYDDCKLGTMINDVRFQNGGYMGNADRRIASLEKQGFDIEKEKREQDMECWRDITMVTKDLLIAWEAYQHSRVKANLLKYG